MAQISAENRGSRAGIARAEWVYEGGPRGLAALERNLEMNRSFSLVLAAAVLAFSSVACAVDPGDATDIASQEALGSTESALVSGPGDITSAPDETRCGGSCQVGVSCDGFAEKCKAQGAGCGTEQVGHPAVGTWLQCVTAEPKPKPSTATVATIDDLASAPDATAKKGCCNQTSTGGLTGCTKPYYPKSGGDLRGGHGEGQVRRELLELQGGVVSAKR